MNIAIYGVVYQKQLDLALKNLFQSLKDNKANFEVEKDFLNAIEANNPSLIAPYKPLNSFETLSKKFDLLITIGGDGTILRAATLIKDSNIPIIGINTGRLGFLATIQGLSISDTITQLLKGNYSVSERSLLSIEASNNFLFENLNFALNEITISRKNTTSMITVNTQLDNEYLTSYWSDGLIISTPTGSTGYSLSCGGPVVMPENNNFILTPIAPHNLNARPLVIPDSIEIKLNVQGRENEFLVSLDSRIITLPNEVTLTVKKAAFTIKMLTLSNDTFLNTLRQKLLWGADRRN